MTEAASLFWRMRELIFDYWPTRIYLLLDNRNRTQKWDEWQKQGLVGSQ